jgi:hypothetical protein
MKPYTLINCGKSLKSWSWGDRLQKKFRKVLKTSYRQKTKEEIKKELD